MVLQWRALGVLPSVDILPEYFGGDYLALVGIGDRRFRDALSNGPNLLQFLQKFEGHHGESLRPSLLVKSDAYTDRPTSEAISSFLDIVVASVILDVRTRMVTWRRNVGPVYSDSFDIYPWMIAPGGDRLVAQNAALWAVHTLDKFRGVPSATVPIQQVGTEPAHPRFFRQLHSIWKSQFIDGADNWASRAILRSLKMVTSALRLSAATGRTESFYDYGRILSLWVSAFEILIHPGAAGTANRQRVLNLIKTIPWQGRLLQEETHSVDFGRGRIEKVSLANALYFKMNSLRNDFLHGNPVGPTDFRLPNETMIPSFPAAIFRMALSKMLSDPEKVTSDDVISGLKSREEYAKHLNETRFLTDCEECLEAAVRPQPSEYE